MKNGRQEWLMMNQREKGWDSYAMSYNTLALLLSHPIELVERRQDQFGLYWTFARAGQLNSVRAVYLGRSTHSRKGELSKGYFPMGTCGFVSLEPEPETGTYKRQFQEAKGKTIWLDEADQVYLEVVTPH